MRVAIRQPMSLMDSKVGLVKALSVICKDVAYRQSFLFDLHKLFNVKWTRVLGHPVPESTPEALGFALSRAHYLWDGLKWSGDVK